MAHDDYRPDAWRTDDLTPDRATIAFLKMGKALALMQGRLFVTPDDIKSISRQVLRHRISLRYLAAADGINEDMIVDGIVRAIRTP